MDVYRTIVSDCWIVLMAVWIVLMFTNKRTQVRDTAASRIRYHLPTLLSYVLMFTPWPRVGILGQKWIARTPTEQALGVALTVAGCVLAIWARLSIGRNWSGVVTVKQDHQLVHHGPYAWVRHPIYTGLILAMTGTALVTRLWAGIAAVVMITAAFAFKSRVEEQFMIRTFGSQYDEYRAHTGAFLPRL